jgi:hypothetical protein
MFGPELLHLLKNSDLWKLGPKPQHLVQKHHAWPRYPPLVQKCHIWSRATLLGPESSWLVQKPPYLLQSPHGWFKSHLACSRVLMVGPKATMLQKLPHAGPASQYLVLIHPTDSRETTVDHSHQIWYRTNILYKVQQSWSHRVTSMFYDGHVVSQTRLVP